MATVKIDINKDEYEGKHVVINCRTGEAFACDTMAEGHILAAIHDAESERILNGR